MGAEKLKFWNKKPSSKADNKFMNPTYGITEDDEKLIAELRSKVENDLTLMPEYDDERSLLRWLIGYDRDVEAVAPKLSHALRVLEALKMGQLEFDSIDDVTKHVESILPHGYLPGSLAGFDKMGNILSIVPMGRLDGAGLLRSTKVSDMYLAKITESEGCMQLIRKMESKTGKQLGTTVILDLDGLSRDALDLTAIKVVSSLLSKLQELFPDVLRKAFVIRAPSFIQIFWAMIWPVLSKQTQSKVELCGSNWRERLLEAIDESVLYEHWGGTKEAELPTGHIKMGGKVPKTDFYVDDPKFANCSKDQITIPARRSNFYEFEVSEPSTLEYWFKCDSGDLDFWIERHDKEDNFDVIWPKFRLLTEHVPEHRTIKIDQPTTIRLYFDNSHGKIFSKQVKISVNLTDRKSVV